MAKSAQRNSIVSALDPSRIARRNITCGFVVVVAVDAVVVIIVVVVADSVLVNDNDSGNFVTMIMVTKVTLMMMS